MGYSLTASLEPVPETARPRARARSKPHTPDRSKLSGHRFYTPGMGRWLSRDPVHELGVRALGAVPFDLSTDEAPYNFVHNNAILGYDVYGLGWFCDVFCNTPWAPSLLCFLICAEPVGGPIREGYLCHSTEQTLDCGKKICGYIHALGGSHSDQLPCILLTSYEFDPADECPDDIGPLAAAGIQPLSVVSLCPGAPNYDLAAQWCSAGP